MQNCPVFNDGVFDLITDRKSGPQHQLWLEHGKPMITADKKKGVRLDPKTLQVEVVTLGEGVSEADLLVHDETNATIAWLVSDLPEVKALGVLYRDASAPVYDDAVRTQVQMSKKGGAAGDLDALLHGGHTWTVS